MEVTIADVVAYPRSMFSPSPSSTTRGKARTSLTVVRPPSGRATTVHTFNVRQLIATYSAHAVSDPDWADRLGTTDRATTAQTRSDLVVAHVKSINAIELLTDGWYNGLGTRLEPNTAALARTVLNVLPDFVLASMSVFPRPRGGLTFEWTSELGYDATLDIVSEKSVEAHASGDGLPTKATNFTGVVASISHAASVWARTLDDVQR